MMKVIINADDLGKNHEVNMAILDALRSKSITSSTIMANSNYWDEIHQIVNENPNASFGVHLNLTEGKCCSDGGIFRKYNVVNSNNEFTKEIRNIKIFNSDLLKAVEEEWDAQINKIVNVESIRISHFDGHHHIHADYPFYFILLRLAEKYNIESVRNRYLYPTQKKSIIVQLIKRMLSLIWIQRLFKVLIQKEYFLSRVVFSIESIIWRKKICRKLILTDYFDSYEHFLSQIEKGYPIKKNCVIELMCHPGHPNYLEEYRLIQENTLQRACPKIQFISYKQVVEL